MFDFTTVQIEEVSENLTALVDGAMAQVDHAIEGVSSNLLSLLGQISQSVEQGVTANLVPATVTDSSLFR